jgi:drug/metabolite transporter (DMT)-like permease
MTALHDGRTTAALSPSGLVYLLVTCIGWGLNWPAMKLLVTALPPLTARGGTGLIGAVLLLGVAALAGQGLHVPRAQWGRLLLSALLNVSSWMTLMGLALLWLPASEAAVIAYSMPVWAALLAWPLLGERPTLRRTLALGLAICGLVVLMGGNGLAVSRERWPGIVLALAGSVCFAFGVVTAKRWPVQLPALTSAGWQVGLGCLPVTLAGLALEHASFSGLPPLVWGSVAYQILVQFCICYVCWFAALARLPASVAAIGSLLVPVIGAVASALTLHEPFGPPQALAIALTIAGVLLATRG